MSQQPLIRVNGAVQSVCHQQMMVNPDNSTSILPTIATFNIGNGFIEIAALTSLIGSATAQALALGNKGPAGLVWATMTIFGGMSVVRAGITTVTPGWLRDSLGVRSLETDAVVGLSLDLTTNGIRYRNRADVAKGVECEVKNLDLPVEIARRDIHVFNQRTIYILNAVRPATPGDPLRIYQYRQDPYYTETTSRQAWVDWTWMGISSIKLAEVFTLRRYDAIMLAWVSLLSWGFFLLAAGTLQLHGYWRAVIPSKNRVVVDTVVASALPIPSSGGGTRKIVLGIPKSERGHVIWMVFWAFSSVVCTVSVILTYMALGQAPSREVFFVWIGFQILWMALRSTFFHIVEDRERPYLASLKGKLWKDVGVAERTRVRNLVHALAKYQYHVHPRGPWSYNEDIQTLTRLENIHIKYPLLVAVNEVELSVSAVIGDTILSSAAWILGSKKGGFDFYDTCIVILLVKGVDVAVPAARVLSAVKPKLPNDPEQGDAPERPARGSSNMGMDIEWWFWIPYGNHQWLHFNSQDLKFKGRQVARVLTDEQVTERLVKGELYVSLKHVDEVKEIVETSTEACGYLLTLFT